MAAKGQTTARRGRKDPALLVQAEAPKDAALTNVFVCGDKPLKMGELTLTKGVEVPGAIGWLRHESWVSSRRIREVRADEEFITFEQFAGQSFEAYQASLAHERLVAEQQAKADALEAAAAAAEAAIEDSVASKE